MERLKVVAARGRSVLAHSKYEENSKKQTLAVGSTSRKQPTSSAKHDPPLNRLSLLQRALDLVQVLRDASLLQLEGVLHLRPVLRPARRKRKHTTGPAADDLKVGYLCSCSPSKGSMLSAASTGALLGTRGARQQMFVRCTKQGVGKPRTGYGVDQGKKAHASVPHADESTVVAGTSQETRYPATSAGVLRWRHHRAGPLRTKARQSQSNPAHSFTPVRLQPVRQQQGTHKAFATADAHSHQDFLIALIRWCTSAGADSTNSSRRRKRERAT